MITLQEVFDAYYQCRKNKRRTINQIKFELDFEHNCIQLWRDINNHEYEIGTSICFIVTRPKLREIFAADFRDRVVHHIIMNKIEPLLEKRFIYDAYNCRKGKGTLFGVNRLDEAIRKCSENYTKDCYVAKFDLKGFFMSISKPLLWQKIEQFINDNYFEADKEDLLYLTKLIVMNCPQYNCVRKGPLQLWDKLEKDKSLFTVDPSCGLAIGNLPSQIFANFYLDELDHTLTNIFDFYGRYVDDFYIVDKDKRKILVHIQVIRDITQKYKIKLHPKKMYLQHYTKGCSFTGSVVKMNRRYAGNRTVGNCIHCIQYNNRFIEEYRAESFVCSINSYFGYFVHCNSYAIKRSLFNLISPKWWRYTYTSYNFNKLVCKSRRINTIKSKIKDYDQNIWIENVIFPNNETCG